MSRSDAAVVISCYNLGRTLGDAVASVRRQSRPADELVIVDDGSDDVLTRQVLAGLERDGVRVLRTPNHGVSAARNAGVHATSASLLVILDADDELEPTYLAQAAARLDADPGLGFVSCAMRGFGAADYVWTPPEPDLVGSIARGVVHVSSMMRREVFDAVGGFDESMPAYEELDFWTRVLEAGFRGEVLTEPLLRYRVRPGSMYHDAIRPGEHVRLMGRFYDRHRATVAERWREVLLAKEEVLLEQREHHRHLEHRRAEVEAAIGEASRQVEELRSELARRGIEDLDLGDLRRTRPLSPLWGQDRGRPLDRYYVEAFLERHAADIRGVVLEIKDGWYTQRFGGDRVDRADVLDVDPGNRLATVTADLTCADGIPAETYDCIVLTQTLNVVYDVREALRHALRVLKPGGVLLCTASALNRISYEDGGLDGDFWRFTEASLRRLLAEQLPPEAFTVSGYGNVLACTAFLNGLAMHELTAEELDDHDPYFPLVYGVRAVKPSPASPRAGRSSAPAGAILMYHRIADDPLDPWGLCVSPAAFRAQMEELRDRWRPTPLGELVAALEGGGAPDRAVAVTFDDGYLDNLTTASPILSELGIPATFFIGETGLGEPSEPWWDTLMRALLEPRMLPPRLDLTVGRSTHHLRTETHGDRRRTLDRLWEVLSQLTAEQQRRAAEDVRRWAGVAPGPHGARRPMTAAELVELARRPGHGVGAHTSHHLRLRFHDEATRRREVVGHRRRLEEILGSPVELLAYPFGEIDADLVRLAREAGFVAAVLAEGGAVCRDDDPLLLPRVEVRGEEGLEALAAAMKDQSPSRR